MTEPAFVLAVHLKGGQTITLACESWELIPDRVTDDGTFIPGGLNYTPHDWTQALGMIVVSDISAIEQTVRADIAEKMQTDYAQRLVEEAQVETPEPELLGTTWKRAG